MDKTLQVNIGGRLFTIEQDAFDRLDRYLKHYKSTLHLTPDEVNEIMDDFEMRIAELLLQNIYDIKRPVQLAQIEKVIATLGTEDEMGDTKATYDYDDAPQNSGYSKRLYRDPDHSVLGGVCSGLGAYFTIDPVWVRLAFILLLFFSGIGILTYIILWIVLTPAQTSRQQSELKGQPVDYDRMKNSVNQELNRVREQFRNYRDSPSYQQTASGAGRVFKGIGMAFAALLKVVLSFSGIVFIVVGVFLLAGVLFGGLHIFHGPLIRVRIPHWWDIQILQTHGFLFAFCLLVIIALPIIGLLAGIVRWMGNSPRGNSAWQAFGITAWSLALAGLISLVIINKSSWTIDRSTSTEHTFESFMPHETLYIKLNNIDIPESDLHYYTIFNRNFTWNKRHDELLQTPVITVQRHDNSQVKLELRKKYYMFKSNHSLERSLYRKFDWELEGNTIWIDPYFEIEDDDLWHWPRMEVVISIPRDQDYVIDSAVAVLMEE